jgi:hypothetical protein
MSQGVEERICGGLLSEWRSGGAEEWRNFFTITFTQNLRRKSRLTRTTGAQSGDKPRSTDATHVSSG